MNRDTKNRLAADGKWMEMVRNFTNDQLLEYISSKNIQVSDERKVHCFLEFLEAKPDRVYTINYDDLSADVTAGVKFFIERYSEQ